jgi:hypothetical protein
LRLLAVEFGDMYITIPSRWSKRAPLLSFRTIGGPPWSVLRNSVHLYSVLVVNNTEKDNLVRGVQFRAQRGGVKTPGNAN